MLTESELQQITPFPFYGYAPGNYMNTCTCCKKNIYNVDKLCFVCLECAIKASIYSEREKTKVLVESLESALSLLALPSNEVTKSDVKEIQTALTNYQKTLTNENRD